ncbi:hypothetical protein NBRC116592_17250 [Colwellia sp. KU-HH00111]|uniref:hypothetical protein n=1 Tax=Colwellia sp. KU-HH00111 TaxID=3127652 RepID=UPI0031056E74
MKTFLVLVLYVFTVFQCMALSQATVENMIIKGSTINGAEFTAFSFNSSINGCSVMLPAHVAWNVKTAKSLTFTNRAGQALMVKTPYVSMLDLDKDYAVVELEYSDCVDLKFDVASVALGDSALISGFRLGSRELELGLATRSLDSTYVEMNQFHLFSTIISGVGLSGSPLIKNKDGDMTVSGMLIGADRHKCLNFDTDAEDKQCIASSIGVVSPFDEQTLHSLQAYRKLTHQRQSPIIRSFTFDELKYQVATIGDAKKWLALFNITAPVNKEYSHYLYSAKPVNKFSIKVHTFYITGIKRQDNIEQMLQQWQVLEASSDNSLIE